MKKRITLLAFLISTSMAFIRCTTDQTIVNEYIVNGSDVSNEKVITNYGAVGDGKTDCSDIIIRL